MDVSLYICGMYIHRQSFILKVKGCFYLFNSMKRLCILILLLLCSFSAVYSQVRISVVVSDEKGAPIPYATVYNNSTNSGAITNDEGRFEMNTQPSDVIVIRCLGYQEFQSVAEQLQKDDTIILKEAIFNIEEVVVTPNSNDAKSIIKKFRFRIPSNYKRQPAQVSGVYKEYSLIENEYSAFFQCDMDILINSIASYRGPFKTKVDNYKSFIQSDSKIIWWELMSESNYRLLGLSIYSFLWNFKNYQYRNMGYITYNKSKLIKVSCYPTHINKSLEQYEGTMYFDMKTYALVFLHFEMLPNEVDYLLSEKGIWQKTSKQEIKIMFEFKDGYYYPAYVIRKITGLAEIFDGNANPDHVNADKVDIVFNFFTKNIEYNPSIFIEDGFSVSQLRSKRVLNQSNYKSNFILETEQEKQLLKKE